MRKLSKADLQEHGRISDELRGARADLKAAHESYNAAVRSSWEELQEAVSEFEAKRLEAWEEVEEVGKRLADVLADAETFRDGEDVRIQDYYDDRSERWQESEAGDAYSEWVEEWEGVDLDPPEVGPAPEPLDLDEPEDLECPDLEAEWDDLPAEPR